MPDETRKLAIRGYRLQGQRAFEINASYAHIFVSDASINGAVSPTDDVLTGTSDDYGNLLSLSALYKF